MRSTPVRSAWTPSRQSDISSIDLQSPKIIAAAKVTGILLTELSEPLAAESPQPSEAEHRRREVMERKRLMLMQELEDTADNLDPVEINAIVSGRNTPAWRSFDDTAVYEREKARIDRNRAKALEDLRREAIREVEKEKATLEYTNDFEKKEERIREMQAAKVEKVQKMREMKLVAAENNRLALRVKRKEKHDQAVNRLKTKDDRFSKHMDELMKARESSLEAKHQKGADGWKRVVDKETKRFQHNMQKIAQEEMRFEMLEDFLEARQLEMLQRQEQSATDTTSKAQIVQEYQQRKITKREDEFVEHMKRVTEGQSTREQNLKLASEKVRERREKQQTKWMQNRQAKSVERRGWAAKKKQEFAASLERKAATVREYREQCSTPRMLTRTIYNELVDQNRDRIQRVDESFRERTMQQIIDNKMRAESIEDQRRQVGEYRVDAVRERWYGKVQIEDLKDCMRNATPDQLRGNAPSRLTDILQDLGVTMPEPKNEKEGEEEEQQRK